MKKHRPMPRAARRSRSQQPLAAINSPTARHAESLEDRCLLTVTTTHDPQSAPSTSAAAGAVSAMEEPSQDWIVQVRSGSDGQPVLASDALAGSLATSRVRFEVLGSLGQDGRLQVRSFGQPRDAEMALRFHYAIGQYERDVDVTAQLSANDEFYASNDMVGLNNTGLRGATAGADISADQAWDITTGSLDVVVAVIDSGIDYTHPDLLLNIFINSGKLECSLRTGPTASMKATTYPTRGQYLNSPTTSLGADSRSELMMPVRLSYPQTLRLSASSYTT